jgi:membrane protein implicated in regulation of membrane protease activity
MIGILGICPEASAQTQPPNDGNWVIDDSTTISDRSIVLNGDLIVKKGGELNLYNVDLQFNCDEDKAFKINVEDEGTLNIYNSEISSSTEYIYEIEVQKKGVFNIYNSTMTDYVTVDIFSLDAENLLAFFSLIFIDIVIIAVVIIALVIFFYKYSGKKRQVMATTIESLVGKEGIVIKSVKPNTFEGTVKVESRTWSATAERMIPENEKVKVIATKGINIIVESLK